MASTKRKVRVAITVAVLLYLLYTFSATLHLPHFSSAKPSNIQLLEKQIEQNAQWKETGLNFHAREAAGTPQLTPLQEQLRAAFPYEPEKGFQQYIWQTWKVAVDDAQFPHSYKTYQELWERENKGYQHYVITDAQCDAMVNELFAAVPAVAEAWNAMPKLILKADFFRYLILYARGGVYSDIDTRSLKPVASWMSSNKRVYGQANRAGLVVGIEADPDRPDWAEWYARRIQFCQWTIQAKKGHPMLRDLVARITELTLERKRLGQLSMVLGKDQGGDIMNWTGPGIFTDTVFEYMNKVMDPANAAKGLAVTWRLFTGLRVPMVLEDVMVLPITAFSPGVGQMGAGGISDKMAYVHHIFLGLWKDDKKGKGRTKHT